MFFSVIAVTFSPHLPAIMKMVTLELHRMDHSACHGPLELLHNIDSFFHPSNWVERIGLNVSSGDVGSTALCGLSGVAAVTCGYESSVTSR